MADQPTPKGSLDHLKKIERQQPKHGELHPLRYQSRGDTSRQRPDTNFLPFIISAIIYWASIFLLVSILSKQRTVDPSVSLTVWMIDTVVQLVVGIAIDAAMKWNWKCTKGLMFAFLLTGGLCGLLSSICGNPFKPFVI